MTKIQGTEWKEKIIIIIQCNKYRNTDMNKMTFTHSFQKHAMNSTGSPPPPHKSQNSHVEDLTLIQWYMEMKPLER